MSTIPYKALRMGAETINKYPVKYNKSRISGSNKTTYNLHIRGASMPGEKKRFTTTSITKPQQNSSLLNNTIMNSYRLDKINSYNYKIPPPNSIKINLLKINEFVPNDDEALLIAINELYKNIFGNFS